MRILKARLVERMREEQQEKLENLRGERKGIDFGSQIRSYVLAPYRMVKDHRTDVEIGDVDRGARRRPRRADRGGAPPAGGGSGSVVAELVPTELVPSSTSSRRTRAVTVP